jgi:hypothetical protein
MARTKRRTSLKRPIAEADPWKTFLEMGYYLNTNILQLNQSKVFAGVVIILLNISSKFVTIKLSKSMEAYLKYTFSRSILIFAMAWMGTRDIYTALFITILFGICANYLFNEESAYCCLPESFTTYHGGLESEPKVTKEQIDNAIQVLNQAKTELGK